MKHEVVMPQWSASAEEGVLVAWFVEPGHNVRAGDLLAEVQVEKTSVEVHAATGGVIAELCVAVGGLISQGAVMAVIDQAGTPSVEAARGVQGAATQSGKSTATATPVLASPAAKRLARELGVDPAMLTGSGPGGRIVEADVQVASVQRKAANGRKSEPITPMRRAIADRLHAWYTETVQVTITTDADVTELSAVLAQGAANAGSGPSLTAAVVRACALALPKHPHVAARWVDDKLVFAESLDIGIAVALEEGLIVPCVRAADKKDLHSLTREIASLAERARASQLKPSEVEGGVFSVSNLGSFGIDAFTPVLNPPQSAILGMGRAKPTAAVVNGAVCVRTKMALSLTFDHRLIDGLPAAAYLCDVVSILQEPGTSGLT